MYRKGLELLLIFSLALNLAFVGVWGYHWFCVRPELATRAAPVWQTQQGTLNLSGEQRERVREQWGELRRRVGGLNEELAGRRRQLLGLLAAPEPDMEAVRAFQRDIALEEGKVRDATIEHLLELRKVLSPEQREKLLRMIQRGVHRQPGQVRPQYRRPESRRPVGFRETPKKEVSSGAFISAACAKRSGSSFDGLSVGYQLVSFAV